MQYRSRVADQQLAVALKQRGAVLLEGVKACGKTETAARVAGSQVRLDVEGAAQQPARTDPGLLLTGDRPRLLDEWQLAPVLWDHVRRAVLRTGWCASSVGDLLGPPGPSGRLCPMLGGQAGRSRSARRETVVPHTGFVRWLTRSGRASAPRW
jgi:hypothetical protein